MRVTRSHAFSLLEIILVLVVLGIIAVLTVPNFSNNYSRLQVKQIADDIKNKARWAQGMAIGGNQNYGLLFAQDNRSYRLTKGMAIIDGPAGRLSQIPSGVTLSSSSKAILFYPDGTIDDAVIKLSAKDVRITLSSSIMRGALTAVDDE